MTDVLAGAKTGTLPMPHHGTAHWNLHAPQLITQALVRGEAQLSDRGALVSSTGACTGRSPKDKFFVREASSEGHIDWGKVNVGIDGDVYDRLEARVFEHLADRDLFVQDLFAGADPDHRLHVRVITQYAWHNLFARQLFIRPTEDQMPTGEPDFTVIDACGFQAEPERDGTRSNVFVFLNFAKRRVLIGGTEYAGEIKKSIFSVMNYLLPLKGVMAMHCSANIGPDGDTALFFGLSGTGKTTLSADPKRRLIGDDEHGWSEKGVFNFEGGCYAKVVDLSPKYEPQIHNAIRFGAVLENTVIDPVTAEPDYSDISMTENTRGAYPLESIANSVIPSVGGHPKNIIFLTCDAFGVLPPISKLTSAQARYHFLSGYTAKVAGTEAGVTEPEATFSTCFGAPFMPLNPAVYAELLGKKIAEYEVDCWLVNTGWNGGPYGVGSRMSLPYTRAMINAALNGKLANVRYETHPVFGVLVPHLCPDVPAEILDPRATWADPAAYDAKANDLANRFVENFKQFDAASDEVKAAGPKPI